MTEEKQDHLLKETWSNIKLATVLVVALMIIFALGYFFSELADKVNIWKGVVFWIIMAIASMGWTVLVLFVIREYKIDTFRKWGDTWMENADKSLRYLQSREIIDNKIVINSREIAKEFLSIRENCRKEGKQIHELKFLGSMVGFSKFLPIEIAKQYSTNENDLTIKIIASNVSIGEGQYRLWLYPLKLIISTLSQITTIVRNIQFEIYHIEIDFPSALFIIGDYKCISTQALGAEAFGIEDNSSFEIIGTIYDNNGQAREEFQRANKSVSNIIQDFTPKENIENWSLRKNNNVLKLSIKNAKNWSFNNYYEIYCKDDTDYVPSNNFAEINGISEIKSFIATFKDLLSNKGIH